MKDRHALVPTAPSRPGQTRRKKTSLQQTLPQPKPQINLKDIFITTLLLLALIFCAGPSYATPQSFIDRVAGVYKKTFTNGLISGEEFQSEDVFEIVKLSDNTAYINYALFFFNGHTCALSGVAEEKNGKLFYADQSPLNPEGGCTLEISMKGNDLITNDTSDYAKVQQGCNYYCGARGTLENVSFPVKSKREIRYMKRLKNSEEFKEALKAYDAQKTKAVEEKK